MPIELRALQNEVLPQEGKCGKLELWVFACGYESRCIFIASKLSEQQYLRPKVAAYFQFKEHKDEGARPENDRFYFDKGWHTVEVSSGDVDTFLNELTTFVRNFKLVRRILSSTQVDVNIDYSCMPRNWYCRIPQWAVNNPDVGKLTMWYAPGKYVDGDFPTAGVDDFSLFGGIPSLAARQRTHFFGLGFDRARSHAIWSVLDPQNLIAFYAKPGSREAFDLRVEQDNALVLSLASSVFTVPLADFVEGFSRIRSRVLQHLSRGDIVLVPDGPKPLILATSLVPIVEEVTGISCFHVLRKKGSDVVDVKASGEAYGFSFLTGAEMKGDVDNFDH